MPIIEHANYYENPLFGADHTHTSCELMFIINGSNEITVNGTTHQIGENDCVLIKSRQHHKVKIPTNKAYHRCIAMINPWELRKQLVRPDLFALLTDTSKEGIVIVRNVPQLRNGFDKMAEIFNGGGNIYAELSAVLEIMSVFYQKLKPHEERTSEHAGVRLTNKVRRYIEENYADSIRISDIAKDNFISEGYLTHTFKSQTGMSPREYLSHIRCTRAYKLIRHTAMKFSDIADITGFCCANDMSRKIREYYEQTPSQIRFSGQNKNT